MSETWTILNSAGELIAFSLLETSRRGSKLVKMRDGVLLRSHELQQRRPPAIRRLARARDNDLDFRRVRNALRPSAHRLRHVGVVATQIAHLEEIVRCLHVPRL